MLTFFDAVYLGAGFGSGPRDGLMTGAVRACGRPVWMVRTGIELVVLAAGWLLGGTVGVGTVLIAFAMGPLVQFFLRRTTVRLDDAPVRSGPAGRAHDDVVQGNDPATGGGERADVLVGGDDLPPARVQALGDVGEGDRRLGG
jgi:hypothetical protein